MLHLTRLEIDGFGPYAEAAVIAFPEEPGVTVVYGDNMRGKTSLLNAIVYALFGEVRGSHLRPRRLARATNRDNAKAGRWGFRVTLGFRSNGADYQLVRVTVKKPTVAEPVNDEDFTSEVYLRRGGETLGPAERARVLATVLPRDVARFFLFDGELLSEYEELLEDESEAGRAISAAIEQILGVPILRTARSHLNVLAKQASDAVAREAQRNQRTAAMGQALAQANERKVAHEAEKARLDGILTGLLEQRRGVEDYLRSREKYARALAELDAAKRDLAQAKETEATRTGESVTQMRHAWRTVLSETVRAARTEAQEAAADAMASVTTALRLAAIATCHCGTCDQDVPAAVRARLDASIAPDAPERRPGHAAGAAAMARATGLGRFTEVDVRPAVTILGADIDAARIDQVTLADRINDLETELAEADEETLRAKAITLSDLAEKIVVAQNGIVAETAAIAAVEADIARLTRNIAAASAGTASNIGERERILRSAAEVFSAAVEGYKASLRTNVEATASGLFRSMTTEKVDYAGLVINDSYGLSIRHREGDIEEGASAAAQQVVALALMGALQANAPLRGPIVMDTPFSRLDPGHKENVVRTLPSMAEQVVLFVQEGEIGRAAVREYLGAYLLREYELVRETAHRTRIEEAR